MGYSVSTQHQSQHVGKRTTVKQGCYENCTCLSAINLFPLWLKAAGRMAQFKTSIQLTAVTSLFQHSHSAVTKAGQTKRRPR